MVLEILLKIRKIGVVLRNDHFSLIEKHVSWSRDEIMSFDDYTGLVNDFQRISKANLYPIRNQRAFEEVLQQSEITIPKRNYKTLSQIIFQNSRFGMPICGQVFREPGSLFRVI